MKPASASAFTCFALSALFTVAGCGSAGSTSATSSSSSTTGSGGTTQAAADFSLGVTPASLVLTSGQAGQPLQITPTAINGFTGQITVTMSGLPAGVTATPATLTIPAGAPQNITLTAPSGTTPASNATVTVTATSGTLSHTATTSISVLGGITTSNSPGFQLQVSPSYLTLQDGQPAQTAQITALGNYGFNSNVNVQFSGVPSNVTISPSTLTLSPNIPQTISVVTTAASGGAATVTVTGTSGTLTQIGSLSLTTLAAQGFTLTIAPTTQTLTIGNSSGTQISVLANSVNDFSGQVNLSVAGLPNGVTATPSTLTLAPGTPQTVTLAAAFGATPGTSTVTFQGSSGSIDTSAPLSLTLQNNPVPDVLTYHYDPTRQGWNSQETILTPSNVNAANFGLTGFFAADGKVDATPLFATQVPTSSGPASIVYVASEHDSVLAFNAATGQQLWQTSVLESGETTSDDHGCDQITPEIGITSTPVIDRSAGPNGTIFVIGMSKDGSGNYHQRLHALDLSTGAEQPGSPTEITASYPGTGENSSNGNVLFDPGQYAERAGLLLLNGTIYTAWTSHCDQQPYTGWVMGFSESTLQQTQVLNLTPNGGEGSIWMSGYGMAADSAANIYFLDANGSFTDTLLPNGFPSMGDYGNAMMKLSTSGGSLSVADYWEPDNTVAESAADIDLGSGGAMLLPDVIDANGATRHLLVGAGKDTNIYVADRDNMGKFNSSSNSNLYQELPGALPQGAWSGPAFFNNTVYYAGVNDTLKAFPVTSALLATSPSSTSSVTFPYPGATPSVSSNGTTNGIVWALESSTTANAVLHAYDATNLSNELYNSNQLQPNGSTSTFGLGNKFLTPVVVDGNVYVGTPTGVAVFGLLN